MHLQCFRFEAFDELTRVDVHTVYNDLSERIIPSESRGHSSTDNRFLTHQCPFSYKTSSLRRFIFRRLTKPPRPVTTVNNENFVAAVFDISIRFELY